LTDYLESIIAFLLLYFPIFLFVLGLSYFNFLIIFSEKKTEKIDFLTKIKSKKHIYLILWLQSHTPSVDMMVSEGFYPGIVVRACLLTIAKVDAFWGYCVICKVQPCFLYSNSY